MADEFDECYEIEDGIYLCQGKEKEKEKIQDLGLIGEVGKATYLSTRPMISKDEARWIEQNFANIFLGFIIAGLSTAFGFYVYFVIGTLSPSLIPNPLWNAVLIMAILIIVIALLTFLQYRLTKALSSTNILERFAVENNKEDANENASNMNAEI